MSLFAPGERYLNRAWSASSGGHREETAACIQRAARALTEVMEVVESGGVLAE